MGRKWHALIRTGDEISARVKISVFVQVVLLRREVAGLTAANAMLRRQRDVLLARLTARPGQPSAVVIATGDPANLENLSVAASDAAVRAPQVQTRPLHVLRLAVCPGPKGEEMLQPCFQG